MKYRSRAKIVISDCKHNTTGRPFFRNYSQRIDRTLLSCWVFTTLVTDERIQFWSTFLPSWRFSRQNGGLYAADQRSPCFLWFRLFQLQIALFSHWYSLSGSRKRHAWRADSGSWSLEIRCIQVIHTIANCVGKLIRFVSGYCSHGLVTRLERPNNQFSTGMGWRTAWCSQRNYI